MKNTIYVFIALCALICAPLSHAQESKLDVVDKTLLSIFQANNQKVLCLTADSSLPVIRKSVEDQLHSSGSTVVSSSPDEIAKAAYMLYPCPFSPYRSELRSATPKDIEGVWLFPEASQPLRYGPKSPAWQRQAISSITCEAVAFYPDGEERVARIVGQMACPFSSAKDMEPARRNPKVSTWSFNKNGRISIARSDVPDHIEEWETFVVTTDFSLGRYSFKQGELLAYLRRERGNEFFAATSFMHLQRLP
jgi:hypothetical protein